MGTKYDTNPLDPEFPDKASEEQTQVLPETSAQTRKFSPAAETQEPSRYNNTAKFGEVSSAFREPNPVIPYQTTPLRSSTKRNVSNIGLPENVLITLPYLPFSIGLIAGLLELLFIPKSETKVRFHAAQGLAAHIGIWIVTIILGIAGDIPGLDMVNTIGNGIFQLVTTVMLIIFSIKAWQGKPVHIESVASLTEWLEDKVKSQNQ